MANYDAHQRVKKDLAQTVTPSQSRNGNKAKGKTDRILLTADKKIADDEFMAAALGDTEWLRQSLRGSKGVINFDNNGLAPIHLAAIHGRLDSLKLLIEKLKVDVNLASTTGWRPIHLVISSQTGKRALSCLQYLLAKRADHSIRNDDGVTPVHQAASEGLVRCLKSLIEAGAVIDGVDGRNHKPVDLAKLWGHRKCARMLATETWHREKDHVAKGMKQLERLQMQNILQEIEQEEQLQAHQQFYGGIAFNQWLDSKGLPMGQKKSNDSNKLKRGGQKDTRQIGPNSKKAQKMVDKDSGELLASKPRTTTYEPTIAEEDESARGTPKSGLMHKPMNTYPQSTSPTMRSISFSPAEEDMEIDDEENHEEKPEEQTEGPRKARQPQWNISTHLAPKGYITNLSDYYPRDEYTMQPKYPLKKGDPVKIQTPLPDKSSLISSASSKRPDLPKDVINKVLSPIKERPVIYKPIAIMDVHKRKYYSDEEKPSKSEAGMHLSNDINSRLFKAGLLRSDHHPTASSAGSSSTIASSASNNSSSLKLASAAEVLNVDVPAVMKLMKQMSRPNRYPAIKGDEYILSTKQIAGV